MRFSSRTPADLEPNDLSAAADERRAAGGLIDLTSANPTTAELPGAAGWRDRIGAALADGARAAYEPDPRGLPVARDAVAAYHAARGLAVDPADVFITCSTSEAYGWLFKLLCDPGDEVLIPTPSYPLFEHLAALDGVQARTYEAPDRLGPRPRTRAVIAVSPNNPTGAVLDRETVAALDRGCAGAGLALIGDEVFADYVAPAARARAASVLGAERALTFSLGGLSKSCGMPHLKLGWIVLAGPAALRRAAAARLEVIADAYLSVATPVQVALPELLAIGAEVRAAIAARVDANRAALAAAGVAALPADGGWTAIVPVAAEDDAAAALLEAGFLAHPGWFFDLPGDHLVLSLLVPPAQLAAALPHLAAVAPPGPRG